MSRMDDHAERLRSAEIEVVRPLLPSGARVLEVGGGNGIQAAILAGWGCRVTSMDLAGRPPAASTHFPVQDYDGRRFPFPDASFERVISNNVLEHVTNLPENLAEQRRVLSPGGLAVHLVPSVAWRFWTMVAHYGYLFKRVVLRSPDLPGVAHAPSVTGKARERGWWYVIRRALVAGPHGEFPSAWSELLHYRRAAWRRRFEQAGFEIVSVEPSGVIYTGYGLFPGLSLQARRTMSRGLGSTDHVFVLRER
jgi:SAM-dependent methyltransferase